jgi:hypothetical protein
MNFVLCVGCMKLGCCCINPKGFEPRKHEHRLAHVTVLLVITNQNISLPLPVRSV